MRTGLLACFEVTVRQGNEVVAKTKMKQRGHTVKQARDKLLRKVMAELDCGMSGEFRVTTKFIWAK
jgi:hypothetical protein